MGGERPKCAYCRAPIAKTPAQTRAGRPCHRGCMKSGDALITRPPEKPLPKCPYCSNHVSQKRQWAVTPSGALAHLRCAKPGDQVTHPSRIPQVLADRRRREVSEHPASAAPPDWARKQKQMSRTELLRRIQKLRERDAKKKPQAAKGQPSPRPRVKAPSKNATNPTTAPPPYYGVEMKLIDGRWVQMHPESE